VRGFGWDWVVGVGVSLVGKFSCLGDVVWEGCFFGFYFGNLVVGGAVEVGVVWGEGGVFLSGRF